MNSATNSTSDKIQVTTTPTDRREQFWKYSDIPFQIIIELRNFLKSLWKTKVMTMLSVFVDKVVLDHKENT